LQDRGRCARIPRPVRTAQVADADVSMVISGPMVTPVSSMILGHGGPRCELPAERELPILRLPENDGPRQALLGTPRARGGAFLVQRCREMQHFSSGGPEWICHKCLSFDLDWHKVSGAKGPHLQLGSDPGIRCNPALKDHGALRPFVLVELADAGQRPRMLGKPSGASLRQEVRIGGGGGRAVCSKPTTTPSPPFTLVLWKLTVKRNKKVCSSPSIGLHQWANQEVCP